MIYIYIYIIYAYIFKRQNFLYQAWENAKNHIFIFRGNTCKVIDFGVKCQQKNKITVTCSLARRDCIEDTNWSCRPIMSATAFSSVTGSVSFTVDSDDCFCTDWGYNRRKTYWDRLLYINKMRQKMYGGYFKYHTTVFGSWLTAEMLSERLLEGRVSW